MKTTSKTSPEIHELPAGFFLRDDLKYYAKSFTRVGSWIAGQIEVTSLCDQQCRMCESWRDHQSGKQRGMIELGQMIDLCDQLTMYRSFEHLSLTGGDPQAWPHLQSFLKTYLTRRSRYKFSLQLNTALVRELNEFEEELWLDAVRDLRVSLDGVNPRTYQLMRGDRTDPAKVLDRVFRLAHPRTAFNVTITSFNVKEMVDIAERILMLKKHMCKENRNGDVRKLMIMKAMGPRDAENMSAEEFNATWNEQKGEIFHRCINHELEISFDENHEMVLAWLQDTPAARHLPCWVGTTTFHIKSNGDMYPCCLVGGEAIETVDHMKVGNIHEQKLVDIGLQLSRLGPMRPYQPGSVCSAVCRWKQASANLLAERSHHMTMAMP